MGTEINVYLVINERLDKNYSKILYLETQIIALSHLKNHSSVHKLIQGNVNIVKYD